VLVDRLKRWPVHKAATKIVVDDYGNAVGYTRRCPSCLTTLPLQNEFYGTDPSNNISLPFQRVCRSCQAASRTRARATRPEKHRARARELYHWRMQNDPRFKAARKLQEQQRLAKDPGAVDRRRAQRRAWAAKRALDGKRRVADREGDRIDNVLRRIRQGKPQGGRRLNPMANEVAGYVAAPPLAAAIEAEVVRRRPHWVATGDNEDSVRKDLVAEIGITSRTLYAWKNGERHLARFDVADRVVVTLDLLWFDVYDPDRFPGLYPAAKWAEVVEQARVAWEGEDTSGSATTLTGEEAA
jgi:hypothetical protein